MGHEFIGEVVETGSKVVTVVKGDTIISPFTISCGECFYCQRQLSSRCAKGALFGTKVLDGAQAEYCRVPLADSTVVKAPPSIDSKKLVLMADIFPTGYFAAKNAFAGLSQDIVGSSTVVLLGCGPVGLCATVNALEFRPQHVLAIDSVEARLDQAKALGAEPWNFQTNMQGIRDRIMELTDGRGADIVIESVGHSSALRLGFELLRPWGIISSIGVHNGEIPWTGNEAYGKNLTIKMGRCPVRSLFNEALNVLAKKQHDLDFMIDNIRPMSDAVQAYDDFHNMKYQKIIFEPGK
ncbi:hypothetical protein PFICI_09548 [Pestalotiopsis fici W106-1]|uniref:Enoyl reductase (ER) domain-containing protein n=1 Tax=Pestalotiopsis fici (strain W106-1 / CGMCC3.15140) TaxID=1229662 RepID=W3X0S1_PESFW|nr:uncharacterized protein PFICI_09548 [Pestalotiopsis fici W106-1]ETS79695.1 hypothetical protein PFICI_09548 [Pestalotiopsis fici W106-1]